MWGLLQSLPKLPINLGKTLSSLTIWTKCERFVLFFILFRYLVFFDDGYAQYVTKDDVLIVLEASKEVWKDVHPDSADFIREYVTKYPERPMVRLHPGTLVSTEWQGGFHF